MFCVPLCFGRFRFISFYRPLGVFSFGSFFFVFLVSVCTFARLVFFVSFVSSAIVSFAFAFNVRFIQPLAFFISGLCYSSWRSVLLGSARLALRGPHALSVCSCLCLVFVAVIMALFSVIIRFSVACVAGVIRFPGCLVFFQWLGCLVFSVARVSGVCSCSCVKRFQLLVCRALSVNRMSRALS